VAIGARAKRYVETTDRARPRGSPVQNANRSSRASRRWRTQRRLDFGQCPPAGEATCGWPRGESGVYDRELELADAVDKTSDTVQPMDRVENPYTPGAGTTPEALTGRDGELAAFDALLGRLETGEPSRHRLSLACAESERRSC
jgi:hypothetical protein